MALNICTPRKHLRCRPGLKVVITVLSIFAATSVALSAQTIDYSFEL